MALVTATLPIKRKEKVVVARDPLREPQPLANDRLAE